MGTMISALAFWIISAPFPFEVSRGPSLELKGGGAFADSDDKSSAVTGARLGYSFSDPSDAFLSGELDFTYHRIFDDALPSRYKNKYLLDGNLVFYEIFNPAAFRLALGGGVERRYSKYRAGINYRAGLGYFFSSRFSTFVDFTGRGIIRNKIGKGYYYATSYEAALSLQYIF